MADKIFLGDTVYLTCNFKDSDGTATNPDTGTIYVTINDPEGAEALASTNVTTKVTSSTSTYYKYWNIPTSSKSGKWVHKWNCVTTVDSVEVLTEHGSTFKVYDPDHPDEEI